MNEKDASAYVTLSAAAGLYALALSSEPGQEFTDRHTWATVVAGNGLILAALRVILPADQWRKVVLAFAVAGVPLIVRSLLKR